MGAIVDSTARPTDGTLRVTKVLFQLPTDPTLTGRYMFHRRILEHEDHDMMRPFDVLPADGVSEVLTRTRGIV